MRKLIPLAAIAFCFGPLARDVRAQVFPPDIPRITIEIETRERWMNARQMAIHTLPFRSTSVILIDPPSAESATAARTLTGIVGDRMRVNDTFRLTTRADGHLGDADIVVTPLSRTFSARFTSAGVRVPPTAMDSARSARLGLTDASGTYLTLAVPRFWDAIPVFNPPRTQSGATWIDTISYTTTLHDVHQSLTGVRRFTILHDTTVAGRQLWVVRDSATIEATERYPLEERHLDSSATVERRTKGVTVGRALYDPALKLYRARTDSTALRGEAVLRYPDGRAFTTPTHYERSRIWTLYDPAEMVARTERRGAPRDPNAFSVVREPRNPLEERVADGDKHTIDSLYAAWGASRDADRRAGIKQLLTTWGARDAASRARFDAARIAEGDTVYLVQNARFDASHRLTMAGAQLLLPLMRDPGLAFQHGVPRDIPYERVVEGLVRMPPAIEADTSKWVCEPAACQLFADQWTTAREPRLKSVGLTVLALINPRQWRDTFLIHARSGDNLLAVALPLIAGNVGRFIGTDPIPAENAPWTAWRDWLRGPTLNPPPGSGDVGRGAAAARPPDWLMVSGNWSGLRFVQASTGRDIAGELRELFASAPNDTARPVAANILAGMKALPWTADSLAKYVMSSSSLMRWFAAQLVGWGYSEITSLTWTPADSSLNDAIQDQFLSGRLSGREPWPSVDQRLLLSGRAGPFQEPPSDALGAVPVYYRSDSLSAPIRGKFGGRLAMMPASEWRIQPVRKGGEFWSISQVSQSGPFARITVGVSGQNERAPTQSPQAWASRITYFLVLVNGQWVLVTKASANT